jgi:methylenetetrahydrofolate dehydrogenase (NADP+)/methenyltetrahydrofolate cyclohydrolase
MAAQILDGKSLAAAVRSRVKESVSHLAQRGIRPGLAVIAAVGRAKLVTREMVKPGACVIDVGVNRGADDHRHASGELPACCK